jgi:hypothetical protein
MGGEIPESVRRKRIGHTDANLHARRLADYARTPVTVTPLRSDPLLRLLICDLVGEEVTRESLATLRDDVDDLRARLDESDRRASGLPHREKYLLLVSDFLRRFLDLHEQLVADVERELAPPRKRRR